MDNSATKQQNVSQTQAPEVKPTANQTGNQAATPKKEASLFKMAVIGVVVLGALSMFSPMKLLRPSAGTEVTGVSQDEADENKLALEKDGLSRNFFIRDYGSEDGDKVSINGSAPILLTFNKIPIGAAPGSLVITSVDNGTLACNSISVIDKVRYELCLAPGETVNTFIKD